MNHMNPSQENSACDSDLCPRCRVNNAISCRLKKMTFLHECSFDMKFMKRAYESSLFNLNVYYSVTSEQSFIALKVKSISAEHMNLLGLGHDVTRQ